MKAIEYEQPGPEPVTLRGYQPTVRGHSKQIDKALEMILDAEQPVIYAGGGVIASDASEELLQLAETLMIPVTTTLMGLGAVCRVTIRSLWVCSGCTVPVLRTMPSPNPTSS